MLLDSQSEKNKTPTPNCPFLFSNPLDTFIANHDVNVEIFPACITCYALALFSPPCIAPQYQTAS
jgi:hypothetical protein